MAWAVWFTGLPGSGKTTVAAGVEKKLREEGLRVRRLELDQIRLVLTPQPTYSEEERKIVYGALSFMAKLLTEEGVNTIIDATGNLQQYRTVARWLIPRFEEVYVRCSPDICMQREIERKAGFAPKNIYEKGKTGQSHTVPGLNVRYDEPVNPLAVIDTSQASPEEAVKQAVDAIKARFGSM